MDLKKLREEQGVQPDWKVCGNCKEYIWGTNLENEPDRHYGSCKHQNDPQNETVSKYSCKFQLHALFNGIDCKEFKRDN